MPGHFLDLNQESKGRRMSMLIGNMYILLLLMVTLSMLDASEKYPQFIVQSWLVEGIAPNRKPLKFDINDMEKNLLDKETSKFID